MNAVRTAAAWAAGLIDRTRSAQQAALLDMQALDAAVAEHLAHGAMSGNDPLTDCIYGEIDAACAAEGAVPPVTSGAGLTPAQLEALRALQADDWWLDWLMPAVLTLAALAYVARLAGWV